MSRPKILVTAAAGHVGRPAVLQLLEAGFPVRAFVRRKDERSQVLEQAGAEVFVGDLRDYRDLRRAMKGIQRAFHCPPFSPHTLYDTTLFAVAAEEARLDAVALLGAWNPHATHPSIHQRGHWIANHVYRWMPSVGTIHIDPGMFAFDYLLGLPAVIHFGQLMLPLGDSKNAPPSNEDIARVGTSALANPAEHIGKSYRPTGPELISPHDIAEILARVLRRKVQYKDTSFRMFSKAARAQGFPLHEIANLRYYVKEHREGAFEMGAPTDHVLAVTGQEPEGFESIARRYVRQPELIHPALKIGNKLDAVAFLIKMLLTPAPDLAAWEKSQGYPMISEPQLAQESTEWRETAERGQFNFLPALVSAKVF